MARGTGISRVTAAVRRCLSARRSQTLHRQALVESLEPRFFLSGNPLIADVNADGVVDDQDIDLIKQQWNVSASPDTLSADLNGDGYVGLDDLNLVLNSPYLYQPAFVGPIASSQDPVSSNTEVQVIDTSLFTDFDGEITGNWTPTFTRDQETVDPSGQIVEADEPRWGDLVATGTAAQWEQVLATDASLVNIGQGPGADGQWLSVWHDREADVLIAFNHDMSAWKTLDISRGTESEWLTEADRLTDTLYMPKTGRIVPGGLWVVYLQRETDQNPSATGVDWTPVGTSFGIVQEVTFDNIFDQARTVIDGQALINSETGEPYHNERGQEWCISITPVVVDGRVEAVWWAITDYLQDPTASPEKPGGSTWVILTQRDADSNHYTVREPRLIEQQEDPLGVDEAFEHRHSAIVVVHETGEVDVIVAAGDTAQHSFLKRYRIDDPDHYETSTLTVQETGLLGITGEASSQLISFQVGSAANKILAATDGRDEGVIELTIPLAMDQAAEVRSVIGRGYVKTHAATVNLVCAKPWERSGYAITVKPFLAYENDEIPSEATTIFYSEDGESWIEIASNILGSELVFHDDWLVIASTKNGHGVLKTHIGDTTSSSPLLIAPGGTQRLSYSLTELIDYEDTEVTFLEKIDGVWVDDGVALASQPPTLGQVVKISRTGEIDTANLAKILLAGTGADFEAGSFVLKVWILSVPGYNSVLGVGLAGDGEFVSHPEYPTSTEDWLPILMWSELDPNGDGSDYVPYIQLTAQAQKIAQHAEFYIAFDLLLNEADSNGTVAPVGDINKDTYVGIEDLEALLANWSETSIPEVIEGDFNGDGFVGIDDLTVVLSNWNSSVTPGDMTSGDATGDGYVGIDDLELVLNNWNAGEPPAPGPLVGDLNDDGFVGLADLDLLLNEWNVARATTGIVPGYSIAPSDTENITADPEKLIWEVPASTTDSFTVGLSMTVPADGIDATWGEDDFSTGSTCYGSVIMDENNHMEVWHHREIQTWSLEVTIDGQRFGAIHISDAWLNVDGRFHWVISYEQGELRFAILQRGNEVASGTMSVTLPFMPTQMQVGSHDWVSVPTVGILSAYCNYGVGETLEQIRQRVLYDDIYVSLDT